MSFTLCSSGAIVIAAGLYVNSTAAASTAILQQFSDDAEGEICAATRVDWITDYSSVASFAKLVLASAASAHAGISLIKYEPSGYTGRGEWENMVNILSERYNNAILFLKNLKAPTKNL